MVLKPCLYHRVLLAFKDLWGWGYELILVLANPNTTLGSSYGLGGTVREWLSTRLILGDPNISISLVEALSV